MIYRPIVWVCVRTEIHDILSIAEREGVTWTLLGDAIKGEPYHSHRDNRYHCNTKHMILTGKLEQRYLQTISNYLLLTGRCRLLVTAPPSISLSREVFHL